MKNINSIGLMLMLLSSLLSGCGSQNNVANDALMVAASKGDATAVQTAISQGADVNYQDKGAKDLTPLMVAASSGHAQVVKQLLDKGADVSIKNGHVTALRMAETAESSPQSKETIRLLKSAGAKE